MPAFSKKAEDHAHMMAIYFMHYKFVRIHQTLKVTPAMAAGVTLKLWVCYGDNLAVLRGSIADESVDLIYLDPPFKCHKCKSRPSQIRGIGRLTNGAVGTLKPLICYEPSGHSSVKMT
jgi:16S rRNA G966 N2-methylase RsmD